MYVATNSFIHNRIRGVKGVEITAKMTPGEASDLLKAGLIRHAHEEVPEVKKPSGLAAPLFVLPPAPASQPEIVNESESGDSQPEKRKRGRPRKNVESSSVTTDSK